LGDCRSPIVGDLNVPRWAQLDTPAPARESRREGAVSRHLTGRGRPMNSGRPRARPTLAGNGMHRVPAWSTWCGCSPTS